MTLPINTFVDLTTSIAAGGVLRTEFGTGLLVTLDTALPAGGPSKVQLFSDINGVNDVFDAGDALTAASVWFGQPGAKSLYIGRWSPESVDTTLNGGAPGAIADITVANASWAFNGTDYTADFSTLTTYAAISAAVIANMAGVGVASVPIGDAGSSLVGEVTVVIDAPDTPGGRQATATPVVAAGAVTSVTITDPGAGYLPDENVGITWAVGTSGNVPDSTAAVLATTPTDAALAGAVMSFIDSSFQLLLAGSENLGFFGTHSAGSGTDISALLGMTAAAGAVNLVGSDAETVTDGVGEMLQGAVASAPVALMLAEDCPDTYTIAGTDYDTRDQMAAFAQAGDFVFGMRDNSAQALVAGDTLSKSAQVFAAGQDHVEPVYTTAGELPDIGLLALMSSQNLNNPASIITPHLKSLPNVGTTDINETQRAELERKRTNVYTMVGGLPSLVGGFTGRAGSWLDAVWWLLWLKNEMELNIFNAQRASRRFNTAILADTIHEVMAVAVRSGGANPGGVVNSSIRQDIIATTGNVEFDGTLGAGYQVWIEQPSARTAADRESRIGRFKVWIAPADAIHKVVGDIVLSG